MTNLSGYATFAVGKPIFVPIWFPRITSPSIKNSRPKSKLAETQAIKRSVQALDNFCKSTKYLKNVKGNAVASALAGLAFIAGSVLSFETGHSLGEYIADNTTRKQPQMVPVEA